MPQPTKKIRDDLKSALVGKIKTIGQVRRGLVAGRRTTSTQVKVTHARQIVSVS